MVLAFNVLGPTNYSYCMMHPKYIFVRPQRYRMFPLHHSPITHLSHPFIDSPTHSPHTYTHSLYLARGMPGA